MTSSDILNVSEADFEFEVIAHSEHAPVIVDFWAEWCAPCKILGPTLERLTEAAGGRFRLAKVDIDENPNLAMQYDIRSVPTIKAFRHGQIVGEFVGAQPESQIRAFLSQVAPDQSDLALEKGEHLLDIGHWDEAEESFSTVLYNRPSHPAAQLGLAKSYIAQGKAQQAMILLENFPASKEFQAAERLKPLAKAMIQIGEAEGDPDDLMEASFRRAIDLTRRGNLPAAMDGILGILRQDKDYRKGEARKVILGMFELLGDDSDITRQYRQEMASILF